MSRRTGFLLPLAAAAMLTACASKWVDDQEAMRETVAGPQGQLDPSGCPKLNLGTIVLDACCATDGLCGGDGTKVGYGCSSLANPMFRSFLSNPPEPKPCGSGGGGPAAGSGATSPTGAPPSSPPMSVGGGGSSAPASDESSSGDADASKCPSVMAFGMTIQPCCTAENHCGADGSAMGFGCSDLGDPMFRMIAGAGVPAAQTCDGMPL
jgi:hypothetical protein